MQTVCPRVLFISHSGDLYGAERSLLTLLRGLNKKNAYELLVFAPHEGAFTRALDAEGIAFHVLPFTRWIGQRCHFIMRYARRLKNRLCFPGLLREAGKWKPDVIYTNTIATPVGAWMADKLPGRPCHIWHAREIPGDKDLEFGLFDMGKRLSFRLMARTSDRFICNSEYLKSRLKPELECEIGSNKKSDIAARMHMDVVLNGIEFAKSIPDAKKVRANRRSFRLIMAGGLGPRKNYEEAVRGVKKLVDAGYDIQLDIYGSGTPSTVKKLRKQISNAGLEHRVHLMGYVDNFMNELTRADMLLITSRMETFGRTAVEAMLCKCPVISSDCGALPEIIEDGETGLLYRSGDIEHLADQIRKLADSPSHQADITQKALEYATKHFSAERFIDEIYHILQDVLSSQVCGKRA